MTGGDDEIFDDLPRFVPGQLVRHRRYGYRGVVVDFDMRCQADDDWYRSNRTQPDRDQPWYHVLADGSSAVTYAAESSLEDDVISAPVRHPVVDRFFEPFDSGAGRYDRNDQPWQGWMQS